MEAKSHTRGPCQLAECWGVHRAGGAGVGGGTPGSQAEM